MYEESVPMRSLLVAVLHAGNQEMNNNYLFLGLHTIISRNMLPTVDSVWGRHYCTKALVSAARPALQL